MAVFGFLPAAVTVVSFTQADYSWSLIFAFWTAASWTLAYGFQDQPSKSPQSRDYEALINNIEVLRAGLIPIGEFLEKEKLRVESAQATIAQLESKKQELEPIVKTQAKTVEAILSAHATRTAKSAWKERAYGFMFGTVASLIASVLYDRFK